jgi:hypothetical protein
MLGRLSHMRFFCYFANSRESIGRYVVEVRKACLIALAPPKTVIRSVPVENSSNFPITGELHAPIATLSSRC